MHLLSGDARRAVFGPLDDGTGRSEAVTRRLGSAIALGLVSDGERLPPESELATALNVSPMTLREALSDLRNRGLVDTRRGRGGGSFVRTSGAALAALTDLTTARLAEVGSSDLRELGDLHAAVAGTAARLAATRASVTEIARLRDICERLGQSTGTVEQRRLDGRYFIEMAASAQSVRLTRMEIEVQVELGQYAWTVDPPGTGRAGPAEPAGPAERAGPAEPAGPGVVAADRLLVVAAIEARQPDVARSLVEEQVAADTARLVEAHLAVLRRSGRGEPTGEDRRS